MTSKAAMWYCQVQGEAHCLVAGCCWKKGGGVPSKQAQRHKELCHGGTGTFIRLLASKHYGSLDEARRLIEQLYGHDHRLIPPTRKRSRHLPLHSQPASSHRVLAQRQVDPMPADFHTHGEDVCGAMVVLPAQEEYGFQVPRPQQLIHCIPGVTTSGHTEDPAGHLPALFSFSVPVSMTPQASKTAVSYRIRQSPSGRLGPGGVDDAGYGGTGVPYAILASVPLEAVAAGRESLKLTYRLATSPMGYRLFYESQISHMEQRQLAVLLQVSESADTVGEAKRALTNAIRKVFLGKRFAHQLETLLQSSQLSAGELPFIVGVRAQSDRAQLEAALTDAAKGMLELPAKKLPAALEYTRGVPVTVASMEQAVAARKEDLQEPIIHIVGVQEHGHRGVSCRIDVTVEGALIKPGREETEISINCAANAAYRASVEKSARVAVVRTFFDADVAPPASVHVSVRDNSVDKQGASAELGVAVAVGLKVGKLKCGFKHVVPLATLSAGGELGEVDRLQDKLSTVFTEVEEEMVLAIVSRKHVRERQLVGAAREQIKLPQRCISRLIVVAFDLYDEVIEMLTGASAVMDRWRTHALHLSAHAWEDCGARLLRVLLSRMAWQRLGLAGPGLCTVLCMAPGPCGAMALTPLQMELRRSTSYDILLPAPEDDRIVAAASDVGHAVRSFMTGGCDPPEELPDACTAAQFWSALGSTVADHQPFQATLQLLAHAPKLTAHSAMGMAAAAFTGCLPPRHDLPPGTIYCGQLSTTGWFYMGHPDNGPTRHDFEEVLGYGEVVRAFVPA